MSGSDWLLLIALSILWGGSFFFAIVAVGEVPPISIVLGRVGIAAIMLHVLEIASGLAPILIATTPLSPSWSRTASPARRRRRLPSCWVSRSVLRAWLL